ncbi:MAG: GGDEF domain-containing protein [Bacillota bacterium]
MLLQTTFSIEDIFFEVIVAITVVLCSWHIRKLIGFINEDEELRAWRIVLIGLFSYQVAVIMDLADEFFQFTPFLKLLKNILYMIGPIGLGYGLVKGLRLSQELITRLKKETLTDYLTGLGNRKFFFARVEEELYRSLRTGDCFTILFMDVDNFKLVNDIYGHDVGDKTLINIVKNLRILLRRADVFCRIGGDEFGAILAGTDGQGAQSVIEKLKHEVEANSLTDTKTGLSIGMAVFPVDGSSVDELINKADFRMYDEKGINKRNS